MLAALGQAVSLPPDIQIPVVPSPVIEASKSPLRAGAFLAIVFAVAAIGLILGILWNFRGRKRREQAGRQAMFNDMVAGTGAWEKTGKDEADTLRPPSSPTPVTTTTRVCPHCQSQMPATDARCPSCSGPSEPWWERDGAWFTKDAQGVVFRWDDATGGWVAT